MKEIEKIIKKEADNSSFEFKEEYWDATLLKLKTAEKVFLIKRLTFGLIGITAIGLISYFGFTQNNNLITQSNLAQNEIEANFSNKPITTNDLNNINTEKNINRLNSIDKNFNTNNSNLENLEQNTSENSETYFDNNIKKSQARKSINTSISKKQNQIELNETSNLSNGNNISANISKNNLSNQPKLIEKTKANATQINNPKNTNLKQNTTELFVEKEIQRNYEILKKEEFKPLPDLVEIPSLLDYSKITKLSNPNRVTNTRLTLQAFAGINISKSFDTKKTTLLDAPYAGLELGYMFQNKLLLTLGAGWYQKTNINYSINSITETLYSYGKNQVMESLILDKTYWLEFPIKISYPITDKQRVGLGMSYSQLLGGKSIYTRKDVFTTYGTSSEETKLDMTETYNGYSDSLLTKSFSVLGSYQYQLNRFGAEIKFHYCLNKIIKNEGIRNNRVTLTLKYSIF